MQMLDVSAEIESHIDQINAVKMLKLNDENSSMENNTNVNVKPSKTVSFVDGVALPSIETYFSSLYANEKTQQKHVNNLIESIGANLIKLEASILGTRTGHSPHMKLYYNFWEKKLLKSLIGLVEGSVLMARLTNCELHLQNDTK